MKGIKGLEITVFCKCSLWTVSRIVEDFGNKSSYRALQQRLKLQTTNIKYETSSTHILSSYLHQ